MDDKYQVFIPHQPPQLSKRERRDLGLSTGATFWLGLAVYVPLVFILNNIDLLGVRHPKTTDEALPLLVLVFGLPFAVSIATVARVNKSHRQARWRQLDDRQAQQELEEAKAISRRLHDLLKSSEEGAQQLASKLEAASQHLEVARHEYSDNAFDPYWNAVEHCAQSLGEYDRITRMLASNANQYYSLLKDKRHTFPVFPVQPTSLPDPSPVLDDFRSVVRMGQTNFHFANIWEHRKTREVLIAGFRTLGDVVNNLAMVVHNEIAVFKDTVESDFAQVIQEQIRSREALEQSLEEHIEIRKISEGSRP